MKESKDQFAYLKALEKLDYIFEGATIPYVLLGETAETIRGMKPLTDLKELEIGVLQRSLSKYSRSVLKMHFGEEWDGVHEVEGIPIKIKLIRRNYGFFKHMDSVPYSGGSFKTANPFDKYFKARFIVQ